MISFGEILASTDWSRMAEPQADGYDTAQTLLLATHGPSPLRPLPYQRRPVDNAPALCDGMVAVRPAPPRGLLNEHIHQAPLDHPNIAMGAALLARWPEAYHQFSRLIDTIYPYTNPAQARLGEFALGSSSHSYEQDFGSVHATVDSSLGLAQALLHEMAHQKLRALGVSFESASRLVLNPPEQRFVSPIRKDRTRPMTAVFHAQYSFIHVTALDLHMLQEARDERERQSILMLLARNVPRMQEGYAEVEKHMQVDAAGALFLEGFMKWSRNVLDQGQTILHTHGYGSPAA